MNEKSKHTIGIEDITKYLAGELADYDRRKVEDWISASEENSKSFELFREIWESADKVRSLPDIDLEQEWSRQQTFTGIQSDFSPESERRSIILRRVLSLAASIVILIGLGIASGIYFRMTEKTSLAETKEIILPDQTKVTLNSSTKLTYKRSYGKQYRTVKLEGEAYFEVQPDKNTPFIVHTEEAEVQVLGTSFNVNAHKESQQVRVSVTEGKVEVSSIRQKELKMTLTNGEELIYEKEKRFIEKNLMTNNNYISWKTRFIEFENEKLIDIIPVLKSVYNQDIILKTPGTGNCTITARFDNKSLESVIAILESTLDLKIRRTKEQLIIQGQNCN